MPKNSTHIEYRHDIDGLRAIAVMLVILFHAQIIGFSGGFIGVDIFFVISGYLITSIILKEMENKNFSFLGFYERRIRRIFPALFVTLVLTTICAAFLFMPLEFKAFGKSLSSTSLFVSNIIFWRESGYFDSAAILKPLLHTWSVTLEEQFYILFPLYLFISLKWFKKFFIPLTIIGLIFSLSLSVWTLSISKDIATFYLLPTRAWEFLIGSLLAFKILPNVNNKILSNILAISGIILIVGANWIMNEHTTFPGPNALYPTLGAFLIIYSGMTCQNIILKWLSAKYMRFTGKISYSLYLYHWPIFVFASYYAMRDFFLYEKFVLIFLCFILAFLSWKYVEQPFRLKQKNYNRKKIFIIAIVAIALFASIGYYIQKSNGAPWRLSQEVQDLSLVQKGPQPIRYYKAENFPWMSKWLGVSGNDPKFIVLGDSHANAVSPALDKIAKEKGKVGLLLKHPGCMPAINIKESDLSKECYNFNKDVIRKLNEFKNIETIYLIARWSVYPKWLSKTRNPQGTEESREYFAQLLNETVAFYNARNININIITEVPKVHKTLVPSILGRNAYYHGEIIDIRPNKKQHIFEKQHVTNTLHDIGKAHKQLRIISAHKPLCQTEKCDVIHNGKSLYYDDDHLSTYGAETISHIFSGSM